MDLRLSAEQSVLDAAAARMLAERAPLDRINEVVSGEPGYDRALFAEMTALGWLDLACSPGGGEEGTLVELGLVQERLGAAVVPGPFAATCSVILTLARFAGSAAAARFLAGARGTLVVLPDAEVEGRARSVRITGQVPAAEWIVDADAVIAAARVGESWYLVQIGAGPGVEVEPVTVFDYERSGSLTLTGVCAPVLATIPALTWADHCRLLRLLRAAELVGCGQRALDLAVRHVQVRHQFGRPIGSFQAVQHQCADMAIDVDTSRLLVRYALWRANAGLTYSRHAAMASWFTGEAIERVTRSAHQVHGGTGVMKEYPLHHLYRHAKAQQLRFGTRREQLADLGDLVVTDAMRDFVGEFVAWPVAAV